jgi:FkbM family methyltransferase
LAVIVRAFYKDNVFMRIAIYGTGDYSKRLLKELNNIRAAVDIVCFVESNKKQDCYEGKNVVNASELCFSDIDKLVVAYHDFNEIDAYLKEIREDYNDCKAKIVDMVPFLAALRYREFNSYDYRSVSLSNGLRYIFAKDDMGIGGSMAAFDVNFAEDSINDFFKLAEKFYRKRSTQGTFFDIGANIGTTSIYVKKIINPKLKVIGIEAGKQNYDLFRVNCIINGCEDITVEQLAMGEHEEEGYFHYCLNNSGGSMVSLENDNSNEKVRIMSLKQYCLEKGIAAHDIGYLWIDTEGFEARIIEGAKDVLKDNPIPLLHEYNPDNYERHNELQRYFNTIGEIYSSFICINEYAQKGFDAVLSISDLPEWTSKMKQRQEDLFFIK